MHTFDKTTRPQDDFFSYVNNEWLKNNPIPSNESRWGTFNELRKLALDDLHEILNDLSSKADKELNSDQKLLKTFFTAAMSYSDNRKNQLMTLLAEINKIDDIKSKNDISNYLGQAHLHCYSPFWSPYVSEDDKDSSVQLLRIYQDGLRLPNRDYYLDDTDKMKQIRSKYKTYYSTVNEHIGISGASSDAVFDIELQLAKASWSEVELRDIEKNYSKFTITELGSRFPDFDWINYFKALGWNDQKNDIIVDQPSFIDDVLSIIRDYDLSDIKKYLSWQVVDSLFRHLDEESTTISSDFYEKVIEGKKEINPLWKRAIISVNSLIIGEVMGKEYCSRHFPESSKQQVLSLVEDIRSAYHKRIDKVTWMNDETKQKAHKKLDKIQLLMGYPSKWHNLEQLKLEKDNHLKNMITARVFKSKILIKKIGKKPDKEEWKMHPQTVNAYCDQNLLVLCFPAAILQPPFFDPDATYASNLGGIGAVIGHEFTHSFDDQGAKFDDNGDLNPWISKEEMDKFDALSKNVEEQGDSFEVVPGIFLKGKLIIGEAIADIGGIEIATEALCATNIDNMKQSLQELFINAANVEKGADREELAIQLAKIDPHPPARFRVNCTYPHVEAFYKAFDIQPSDKMYLPPEKRTQIW